MAQLFKISSKNNTKLLRMRMEVDSVYSVIERKLKHESVYIPQNYMDVIREACYVRPY